jgi:hypothetical protein
MSKKIGIISEHHRNDGEPVAVLLQKYFEEQIQFVQFCTRFTGSRIKSEEALIDLELSCDLHKPDFVIVIRDLDKNEYKTERKIFFEQCQVATNDKALCLLFIYMIEAIAFADIDAVCKYYSQSIHKIRLNKNTKNAKNALKEAFGYTESDMRGLVEVLDVKKIEQNYDVWKAFLIEFSNKIE